MYSAKLLTDDATPLLATVDGGTATWDPPALAPARRNWKQWIGPAISLAVLVAALTQLGHLDRHHVLALVPVTPLFWLAFVGCYMALPFSEWLIYRRLWGLPIGGLLPLLRKRISNEILLGYSGEVYFYDWARRRTAMTSAPFGAIKDVTILSGQVGNIVTLAMLAIAWPLLGSLDLGAHGKTVILSCAVIVATSLPVMLLRDRVFSLPWADLRYITLAHLGRVGTTMVLTACMWHEALPGVALSWWVMLSALRQLLSRLPFLPNKDLVFAGLAVYLVGQHEALSDMIAMTATVILAAHILLGSALGLADLLTPSREESEACA